MLNRAVAWKLIDDNPRQARAESRPALPGAATVRVLAADPVTCPAARPDPRADGRVRRCNRASTLRAVRARTRGHRSCGRCRPHPRAYANRRVKHTKTRLNRRAVPLQAIAIEALDKLQSRQDGLLLFPNARGGYLDFRNFNRRHWKPVQKAVGIEPLRDLYDLRHTCATFALRAGVRSVTVHGYEHRDDRSPLRPSRGRQPRARRVAPRCACARAGGGRWVDVDPEDRRIAQRFGFQASPKAFAAGGGRSVDVEVRSRDDQRWSGKLINRNF